jgi:hypothetical protein
LSAAKPIEPPRIAAIALMGFAAANERKRSPAIGDGEVDKLPGVGGNGLHRDAHAIATNARKAPDRTCGSTLASPQNLT